MVRVASLSRALAFHLRSMFIGRMDIIDLTSSQLKRAAAIKDRIEALNSELRTLLGGSAGSGVAVKKRRGGRRAGRKSVSAKAGKAPGKAKKKVFSAATRAKLSARLKAYWAAKRAGKK